MVFMSPYWNISRKSVKTGYFVSIFADLSPLCMIDMVFAPISHFTFPHTFSAQFLIGVVPNNHHHWDGHKFLFWKTKTRFFRNRLFSSINNIRHFIITKYSLQPTWRGYLLHNTCGTLTSFQSRSDCFEQIISLQTLFRQIDISRQTTSFWHIWQTCLV